MPDCEKDPEPQVQIEPRRQTKSKSTSVPHTASPTKEDPEYHPRVPSWSFMEDIEIEMEVSQHEGCDVGWLIVKTWIELH